jgi:hypothetical protein
LKNQTPELSRVQAFFFALGSRARKKSRLVVKAALLLPEIQRLSAFF